MTTTKKKTNLYASEGVKVIKAKEKEMKEAKKRKKKSDLSPPSKAISSKERSKNTIKITKNLKLGMKGNRDIREMFRQGQTEDKTPERENNRQDRTEDAEGLAIRRLSCDQEGPTLRN